MKRWFYRRMARHWDAQAVKWWRRVDEFNTDTYRGLGPTAAAHFREDARTHARMCDARAAACWLKGARWT